MFWACVLALSALVGHAATQGSNGQGGNGQGGNNQSGNPLDAPMLANGGIQGPGAMLRFGCSQSVIERLDPCVSQVALKILLKLTVP